MDDLLTPNSTSSKLPVSSSHDPRQLADLASIQQESRQPKVSHVTVRRHSDPEYRTIASLINGKSLEVLDPNSVSLLSIWRETERRINAYEAISTNDLQLLNNTAQVLMSKIRQALGHETIKSLSQQIFQYADSLLRSGLPVEVPGDQAQEVVYLQNPETKQLDELFWIGPSIAHQVIEDDDKSAAGSDSESDLGETSVKPTMKASTARYGPVQLKDNSISDRLTMKRPISQAVARDSVRTFPISSVPRQLDSHQTPGILASTSILQPAASGIQDLMFMASNNTLDSISRRYVPDFKPDKSHNWGMEGVSETPINDDSTSRLTDDVADDASDSLYDGQKPTSTQINRNKSRGRQNSTGRISKRRNKSSNSTKSKRRKTKKTRTEEDWKTYDFIARGAIPKPEDGPDRPEGRCLTCIRYKRNCVIKDGVRDGRCWVCRGSPFEGMLTGKNTQQRTCLWVNSDIGISTYPQAQDFYSTRKIPQNTREAIAEKKATEKVEASELSSNSSLEYSATPLSRTLHAIEDTNHVGRGQDLVSPQNHRNEQASAYQSLTRQSLYSTPLGLWLPRNQYSLLAKAAATLRGGGYNLADSFANLGNACQILEGFANHFSMLVRTNLAHMSTVADVRQLLGLLRLPEQQRTGLAAEGIISLAEEFLRAQGRGQIRNVNQARDSQPTFEHREPMRDLQASHFSENNWLLGRQSYDHMNSHEFGGIPPATGANSSTVYEGVPHDLDFTAYKEPRRES